MVGSGPTVFAVWAYVIANAYDSIVELNPTLLAAILGTTYEDIEKALTFLTSPDPHSRNQEHEGRRLIHRTAFAYFVPSWEKYDAIRNEEERREYMKEYMRERRKLTKVNRKPQLAMLAPSASASALTLPLSRGRPGGLDEVLAYCQELNLPEDEGEAFYDHFTSNGWKVGGRAPMKDWKAAVRNWRRRCRGESRVKVKSTFDAKTVTEACTAEIEKIKAATDSWLWVGGVKAGMKEETANRIRELNCKKDAARQSLLT